MFFQEVISILLYICNLGVVIWTVVIYISDVLHSYFKKEMKHNFHEEKTQAARKILVNLEM